MLDTNAVSAILHSRSAALDDRIGGMATGALCVSILTFGETMYGLAKRPTATRLRTAAERLFASLTVMKFDAPAAMAYGTLRAALEAKGKPLGPLDMLIAAHALAAGATLVSADRAFRFVPGLVVEDWTQPPAEGGSRSG